MNGNQFVPIRDRAGIVGMRLAGEPPPEPQDVPPVEAAPPLRAIDPLASGRAGMFAPAATPVASARPLPSRRVQAASAVLAVVVLALAWLALRPTASAPAALPTPAPVTSAPAPAAAVVQPSATPTSGCRIVATTATFYAPAGSPAPIAAERGQTCHLVAWHSAFPDWRQITIGGGAPVWVPLATLSEASTAALPDLAPPPTPTPAPATARPVVVIEQIVVTPTPCVSPAYTRRLDTAVDGLTIGYAVGESCVSQDEADTRAAQLRDQDIAQYRATHPAAPTWSDLGTYAEQATDMAIVSSLHDTPTPARR